MGLAPGLLAGLYMLVSVLTQPRPKFAVDPEAEPIISAARSPHS